MAVLRYLVAVFIALAAVLAYFHFEEDAALGELLKPAASNSLVNTCCYFDAAINAIKVVTTAPVVERELNAHKDTIGNDFPGYRGHVYRVLTYAMHFLQDTTITAHDYELLQLALVYHDIGKRRCYTSQTFKAKCMS